VVAEPPAGSAAAAAGLHAGDVVRAIDGEPVVTWQDLRWRVLKAALQREAVQLETLSERGHIQSSTLDLRGFPADEVEKDVLERIGLNLHRPPIDPILGRVDAGPGQRAGLLPGDLVTHIDGAPVSTWMDVVRTIQQSADKQLAFGIVREGKPLSVQVTPEAARDRDGKTIGRVGIGVRDSGGLFLQVRYGLGASLLKAVDKTVEISLFSLKMLGKMLLGQVSWKHLSGPVTIADFAGQSAQMGLPYFLNFLALISISLGVLNLLPIPLLDGGHLMYYLIEIAKGKPVSERVMELGQRVGLALLLVMMAFAFYNDLNRLLTG
jgi:regulator of sigma E protease